MTDLSSGVGLGLAAMFCWGVGDFFAAKMAKEIGPLRALLWTQGLSFGCYLLFFIFFFQLPEFSGEQIWWLFLNGVLSTISYVFFYKGFQKGLIAIISPIAGSWGAITALLSVVFLHQTLPTLQIVGVILAFVGGFLTCFQLAEMKRFQLKSSTQGLSFAFISVLATSVQFTLMDPLVKTVGWFLPILVIRGMTFLNVLSYGILTKKDISFPRKIWQPVLLVSFLEVVGIFAYSRGIVAEYTSLIAPIAATFPIITVTLALIFLKEKLEFYQKIGIFFVLGGLVLLSI